MSLLSAGGGCRTCARSHPHRHGEEGPQGRGPGQSLEGRCPGTAVEVTGVRVSRGLRDGGRRRGSPWGRLGPGSRAQGRSLLLPAGPSPRGQYRLASGPYATSPGPGSRRCLEALHLPGLGSALKVPVLLLSPDRESIWAQGDPELWHARRLTGPSEQTPEVRTTVPPLVSQRRKLTPREADRLSQGHPARKEGLASTSGSRDPGPSAVLWACIGSLVPSTGSPSSPHPPACPFPGRSPAVVL